MHHVLKNINQSDFVLFVATLKILLQIWCRKTHSPGTLVIGLAKELWTLILKFILFSNSETIRIVYRLANCSLKYQIPKITWRESQENIAHFLAVKWSIKQGLITNSSLVRTNLLRPALEKNGVILGHAFVCTVCWVIFENILHHITKQDPNHSGHERHMIKETKKVWHLPDLFDS